MKIRLFCRFQRIPHVVGVFQEGRGIEFEYEFLSRLDFKAGNHPIPLTEGTHELDIVDHFLFSPAQTEISALGPGQVQVTIIEGNPKRAQFQFEQEFDIDGTTLTLDWDNPLS